MLEKTHESYLCGRRISRVRGIKDKWDQGLWAIMSMAFTVHGASYYERPGSTEILIVLCQVRYNYDLVMYCRQLYQQFFSLSSIFKPMHEYTRERRRTITRVSLDGIKQ
jgi:hypothetical protein